MARQAIVRTHLLLFNVTLNQLSDNGCSSLTMYCIKKLCIGSENDTCVNYSLVDVTPYDQPRGLEVRVSDY